MIAVCLRNKNAAGIFTEENNKPLKVGEGTVGRMSSQLDTDSTLVKKKAFCVNLN